LFATTATGTFTLGHLRLNRSALVAYRLQRREYGENHRLIVRLEGVIALLEKLGEQNVALLGENRTLLQRQGHLLRLLSDRLADDED